MTLTLKSLKQRQLYSAFFSLKVHFYVIDINSGDT